MDKCQNEIIFDEGNSEDIRNKSLDVLNMCLSLQKLTNSAETFLIDLSSQIDEVRKQELSKLPFHLNLLRSFASGNLKETAHSRFLWNLLRVPKIMDSFMKHFFAEISESESKCKVNYPDRYRIDISVEGRSNFFIIENKINDAEEQCGQIFRYVNHGLNIGYSAENIHVLNSHTHDSPSAYSLSKEGKGSCFIPEEVSLHIISYKDEIVEWLETIYSSIMESETYLKSALFQYIDYLKEKFKISDRFNDMNNKVSSILKGKLFASDMSVLDKLNIIADTMQQLDDLRSDLERLAGLGLHELRKRLRTLYYSN